MTQNPVIWTPTDESVESSALYKFMQRAGFEDYDALHHWSVTELEAFWSAVVDDCAVRFSTPATEVLRQDGDITTARWFDGARLNFAEHLLRVDDDRAAIIFRGENGARRELSFAELRQQVADQAAAMRKAGIVPGDRIAGYLPNCPEAIIAMLAAASIGATWSSCSPDFGINGVVDRFGQIEPRVLFCADGYFYNGKTHACLDAVAGICEAIDSIETVVVIPFTGTAIDLAPLPKAVSWSDYAIAGSELEFTQLPFDHPLYIMYSSGTTGAPKCIVHGAGGTLLQHLKEHRLHCDINERDRLFYFTTCGWMMWNWQVSGLATGATLVLYDGSPFANEGRILWELASAERVTVFGTGAKYISALEKAGVRPVDEFDLSSVRAILSTGSPLAPASFDYVYDAISKDVMLASIAGGTDIISCFVLGNPLWPVRRGEIQCIGLGMAVSFYDDDGNALVGENGELVCTRPAPSMPTGFWNDPDNHRYHAAYFERFPGVWAHGDFAELTESGGIVIHGRSDAVLNPGGVRIGTSEIYRQVEKLDEVVESIAIGQDWEDDVRVVLFVVLREGLQLDDELRTRIRKIVRENATPRHVPARIAQVPEIPRTISGKIVELAVRSVVHGDAVKNTDALANPAALEHFRDVAELRE